MTHAPSARRAPGARLPIVAAGLFAALCFASLTADLPWLRPAAAQSGQAVSGPVAPAHAQPSMPEFPQLTLSADAWREVAQDRVTVTLYASHEAPEPGPAQLRVNEQLNPVLERLKGQKDLEVQSAGYRTDPVWKDSRVVAWRARGAVRLTAAPSEAFNKLVGELAGTLNVESVAHFLSREARTAIEQELIAEAVMAFRAKAQAASQALGFKGWAVRAVSVSDSGPGHPEPVPRPMMARAALAEAAPMPIAEGKSMVSVSVSGSVLLER